MIKIQSFVDLHTHTRYPDMSYFSPKEIEVAAKNGGYSEILAMPNSEIVIDTIENLNKAIQIDNKLNIKVHRTAALTKGLKGAELVDYKEFVDNGIFIFSDDGMCLANDDLAEEAFKTIASLNGAVFQHCEKSCHSNPGDIAPPNDKDSLISIHESEESDVLLRDIKLVEKYGTRYHVQHISTKKCVEYITEAKENSLPITSEVTPHHLLINNEHLDIGKGDHKMYPPIRTEEDRLSLVEGLQKQVIDIIATDHAPHPPERKYTDFKNAARGVVGLESAFPMLYTSNIFSLDELKIYMIENPRKILSEIGYKLRDLEVNSWKKCSKKFTTKSKYTNSIFEQKETKIEKVMSNV